jgi:hypothetical protein
MIIKYQDCKDLIEEADVLLFRHGNFPSIGWWIGKYSQSPYSHVGLAHWENGVLNCVEFREFIGSRNKSLLKQVAINPDRIDVYKPSRLFSEPIIEKENDKFGIVWKDKVLTKEIRNNITQEAIGLVGKPYGWSVIWRNIKSFIPFLRLSQDQTKGNDIVNNFVCSTLITYAYRLHYVDPIPFLADTYTQPGDLPRSNLFHYAFTIGGF